MELPYEVRARVGLATLYRQSEPVLARLHLKQALEIFRVIGLPEADDVERSIGELDTRE